MQNDAAKICPNFFLLHCSLFQNNPIYASLRFVIRTSGLDQKPFTSGDEISQGSNNFYLRTILKICLHVFALEFPLPLSLARLKKFKRLLNKITLRFVLQM